MTLAGRVNSARLLGDGTFSLEAVGESFYPESFQVLFGPKTEEAVRAEFDALLVLENDNPHDDQAVAVRIDGLKVGHLSRADARELRAALRGPTHAEQDLPVRALIVGGWFHWDGSEGDYGVRVDAVQPFVFTGGPAS